MIRFSMRIFLIGVILTTWIATACGHRGSSDDVKYIRPKRFVLDNGHGLTATQTTQIQNGFTVASHLADKMAKLDFKGVTGALLGSISSYLGALGPFVGLVLSFLGGESATNKLLKQLYTTVENRFDQVDVQFAQLRRQVAFVPTQVHLTDLESNINAAQAELNILTKVTNTAGYKYESNKFKHLMSTTYASSGTKLYNSIKHGGLTTGGIFHEFMLYSKYDRKATQRFMLGTLNLLMRAAALEMTDSSLDNDPNQAIKRREWESHFSDVKSKMTGIDNEIVHNYHNQMVSVVNDFASQHPKGTLSNSDFSSQLYNMLNTKFFWRDWLVIVAAVHGSDRFVNHACEVNQHDNHGRSIVVASVDKTIKATDSHTASSSLHALKLYWSFIGHGDQKRHYLCINSNDAYSHLPDSARNHCNTYAAAGVMCSHIADSHVHAASGRYHSYTPHSTANTAYVFG